MAMASHRISVPYRRMKIVARKLANQWEARAFDQKAPASPIRFGPTSDDAILAVKSDLDRDALEERSEREEDGFPTVKLVKKAFARIRPSDGQLAMLAAHLNAPGHVLTASELASAAGKNGYEYANLQYGRLARDLAEEMEFTPSESYSASGQPIWTYTLATGVSDDGPVEPSDEYVEWRWKLRPQLVDALTDLGIR